MPSASDLRQRITLLSTVRGRDALGGVLETPGNAVDLWAKVEPVGADERFEHARLAVRPTHRITIRWRAGVAHRDTVTFRDRPFDVLSAQDPDERRLWLVLLVAAREPGA